MNWRKSSYSSGESNCVEIADSPETVKVRDSKYPRLGHLTLPAGEWRAFLAALRREEL